MTCFSMRLFRVAVLVAGLPLFTACDDSGRCEGGEGEGTVFTLELHSDSPGDDIDALVLSNDTLVFPLARDEETQSLSKSAPGDLFIAYTRVGCWIDDPGAHLTYADVREVSPGHLTRITIDQVFKEPIGQPTSLDNGVCFTYRDCTDEWHPLIPPTSITAAGNKSTTALDLDATGVNAVAIFLPDRLYASRVTYTAE